MFDHEIWKKSFITPDYEVSNFGRVRSVDRVKVVSSGYSKRLEGKVLNPFISKATGYLQVKILGKKHSVHRMIAMAFCNGYKEGLFVNHKNGIKSDNRAENLEWVTPSENVLHGYRELGRVAQQLGKFGELHHTHKPVISICIKTGERKRYGAAMDAVREGFDSSSISRCCNGISAYHKGRFWHFEGESNA
ncbi:NUMOD4 motif-containing HNH endonuclease [Pseudescherichia vulneris]|uniref:NUMOD4 motif-containing HNH endonuclease n=1 Tax=Pseudescherichia vulneris TaxID=566 RepID=UPI00227B46EE|nr:NUMOD4 motif-containing HNH endonuclease [Pseudescherichia vulneris]WAH52591.1 NUMOD4 motif-containing HNH endonuclease [Pseudescherichia vulneris]